MHALQMVVGGAAKLRAEDVVDFRVEARLVHAHDPVGLGVEFEGLTHGGAAPLRRGRALVLEAARDVDGAVGVNAVDDGALLAGLDLGQESGLLALAERLGPTAQSGGRVRGRDADAVAA